MCGERVEELCRRAGRRQQRFAGVVVNVGKDLLENGGLQRSPFLSERTLEVIVRLAL